MYGLTADFLGYHRRLMCEYFLNQKEKNEPQTN